MLSDWMRRYRRVTGGGLFTSGGGDPLAGSPYLFTDFTISNPWTPVSPWAEPRTSGRLFIASTGLSPYTKRLGFNGGSGVTQARITDSGVISIPHRIIGRSYLNVTPGSATAGVHLFFGVGAWGALIDGYSFVLNGTTANTRFIRWDAGTPTVLASQTVSAYNADSGLVFAVDYNPATGDMEGRVWTTGDMEGAPADPDISHTDVTHGAGDTGVGNEYSLGSNAFYEVRLETA